MSKSNQKLTYVPIDAIQIGDRRTADRDKVERLAGSIKDTGLLNPIGLTPKKRLVHGLHRLEACKLLGWKKIPAVIHDFDDLHAELAEIDENLMRSELTKLQRSEAMARRKDIYEALHPETRHGGDRKSKTAGSSRQIGGLKSFAKDTAEKTGASERTIQRDVRIGRSICSDVLQMLKGHPIEDKQAELEKLGRLPEVDQRLVAEQVTASVVSVADAIRSIEGPWSPKMREIVIDKQALRDFGKAEDYDTADRDAELKRLAYLPVDEQRVVAKMVANGEAGSVFEAIDAMAAPEDADEPAEEDSDPPAEEDVHTNLPADATEPGGESPENNGSADIDPARVYRDVLLLLREKIPFLVEHFDDVVGHGLEPSEAAKVLEQAIDFFGDARAVEVEYAAGMAETEPTPCGA